MFSGIVETTALINAIGESGDGKKITLLPQQPLSDLKIGDSIAINGICLTVTNFNETDFSVFVVPETIRKTNIAQFKTNDTVNLEQSLRANARVSGHFVQGHIDGTGTISAIEGDGDGLLVKIKVPQQMIKYIVKKGFIGIDGMSITVIEVGEDWFTITLIPHTREVTIAKNYQAGSSVNIEVDMLAKYIENFVEKYHA